MTDHTSENARVSDPYCPLHGSRPTAYDLCSCKNKAVIDSVLVERVCEDMVYAARGLCWDEVPAPTQSTMRIAVEALLEWQHFRNGESS